MEKIELYYRPEDVGDGDRYEANCGEADASGPTPFQALANLAGILEQTPAADAVRAAKVVSEGPRAGEPVPVSTPAEALQGELADTPVATGPATAPTAPTAQEADAAPSGPTPPPPVITEPKTHPGPPPSPTPPVCPDGYVWDEASGQCVKKEGPSLIERFTGPK